jgi:hypothetical protein
MDYFKAPLVGISEFPAIILAIHSIPFQKGFPGIFPARAQYFLLPGNFLASGRFEYTYDIFK